MADRSQICNIFQKRKKQLILLVDPDKFSPEIFDNSEIKKIISDVDMFFVGGSFLMGSDVNSVVRTIRSKIAKPILLFPGSVNQLSENVDAVLFLSLLSGRNPEYLIGQQVQAAPFIYEKHLKTIPTAYILIDGGKVSSTQYVSNTMPIPADKSDIAVATALAAKFMGFKLIYLEAGSGAKNAVPKKIIEKVANAVDLPIIVGGGIRDAQTASDLYDAGADALVVGTAFEQNPKLMYEIVKIKNKLI